MNTVPLSVLKPVWSVNCPVEVNSIKAGPPLTLPIKMGALLPKFIGVSGVPAVIMKLVCEGRLEETSGPIRLFGARLRQHLVLNLLRGAVGDKENLHVGALRNGQFACDAKLAYNRVHRGVGLVAFTATETLNDGDARQDEHDPDDDYGLQECEALLSIVPAFHGPLAFLSLLHRRTRIVGLPGTPAPPRLGACIEVTQELVGGQLDGGTGSVQR